MRSSGRRREVCTSCGHLKSCDDHHPARSVAAPDVTVSECASDHGVLTRRQERAGMMRAAAPRTAIERIRWIYQGAADIVDRFRARDEPNELSVACDHLGAAMTAFAALALGAQDIAENPELGFGPDPIVRTPRTFRGRRPSGRPEWRSVKEPPTENDVPRLRALFDMFHEIEIAIFGVDRNNWDELDVQVLHERLSAWTADDFLSLVGFAEDSAAFLDHALGASSATELFEDGEAFDALYRICSAGVAMIQELGGADVGRPTRSALKDFLVVHERERVAFSQTPGDGTELPPGRGPRLHEEE